MRPSPKLTWLVRLTAALACLVVIRTTVLILLNYGDYFPPNFTRGFLQPHRPHFAGVYAAAFYTHIVTGPVCLLLGLALIVDTRAGGPARWHRPAGKLQAALVLLAVAPSGLVMACWSPGTTGKLGFGTLAVATGVCVALGWRTAARRRFAAHRRWMQRTYALLASAVVLRAMGGAAEVLEIEGLYPAAAWVSWLLPLAVLEAGRFIARLDRPLRRQQL